MIGYGSDIYAPASICHNFLTEKVSLLYPALRAEDSPIWQI